VHYDSADERGIDVALLYNKDYFTLTHSETFSVFIENDLGVIDYTRDILLVSGLLDGEKMHFMVNHWPSRHEGSDVTEFKRLLAADKVVEIINQIKTTDDDAKIVVMGDFNDNPNNKSVMHLKETASLFNPMETVWSYSRGSVNHNFAWIMFDQILFTTNFFEHNKEEFSFDKADIFDEDFLTQYSGKFRGQPYRTYVGKKYKGGFSDHFPVYILLKK
jgi:predicted extracellular nuclease